jgi:hypothetical protein
MDSRSGFMPVERTEPVSPPYNASSGFTSRFRRYFVHIDNDRCSNRVATPLVGESLSYAQGALRDRGEETRPLLREMVVECER